MAHTNYVLLFNILSGQVFIFSDIMIFSSDMSIRMSDIHIIAWK